VFAANLTGGAGGIGGDSDADLRRVIRTGMKPDGTHVRIMPIAEYAVMTDADVDDLIAFLRSLPPVDHVVPSGALDPDAARAPATNAAPITPPDAAMHAGATALTGGAYLVTIGGCTNCHGANLAGRTRPNGPVAPNISHDGIGTWSFADFQTAMRTGKTPDGRVLSTAMPWPSIGGMTDAELRSVYDYIESRSAPPT
jgi:mono/diheme cytochrome c family protein